MGKEDEVLPDSQDEGELDVLDLLGREVSPPYEHHPLTNASIPSLSTSPSYVLTRPIPANHAATSTTISQFTTDTVLNTIADRTSTISAFNTSSLKSSAKPRPKPKPNYAGALATHGSTSSDSESKSRSIESPSVTSRVQDLPFPERTFTADISERTKARRASKKQRDNMGETKAHSSVEEAALAVEAVIEISSDDILPESLNIPPSSNPPREQPNKQPDNLQSVASPPVNGSPTDSSLIPYGGQDACPAISLKRMREPLFSHTSPTLPSPIAPKIADSNVGSSDVRDTGVPPTKKKKGKVIDDTSEEPHVSAKAKKKRPKDKQKQPKNRPATSKEPENDQFKSSKFILDSDDEETLGNRKRTGGEVVVSPRPITTTIASSLFTESPLSSPEAPGRTVLEPLPPFDRSPGSRQPPKEIPTKKAANQKRKTMGETQNDAYKENIQVAPSKKARRDKDTADFCTAKEKPQVALSIVSKTQSTTSSAERGDVSGAESDILKTKKKRGARKIIDDDEEEENTKENAKPPPKYPTRTTPIQVTKPPQITHLSSKLSYAHPPKNRPLSAILQLVNGSSPRPRASPSISRSLLTRIVPLHPNRRTPPPPPPPRIIPKKTKKEIEREEKWEEELQETVEGWCELEEAERERLRRAKRDWELGLCEE